MLEGELNSMSELYKTASNLVPRPYTWGKLNFSFQDIYYFLCDFIEMTNENPDVVQLCTRLVQMHRASESPTKSISIYVKGIFLSVRPGVQVR